MKAVFVWTMGLVVSLGLHAGLILVLPIWLAPEPIDNMPRPQSELRIETQEVARSESSATAPQGDRIAQEKATGAELGQGVIPESRATPEAPEATALEEAPPPPPTAASSAETPPLPATEDKSAPVAATAPATATLAADLPDTPAISASAETAVPVAAATLPAAVAVSAALPETAAVAAATLPTEAAVIAAPLTETVTVASNLDAALIQVSAELPETPAVAAAPLPTEAVALASTHDAALVQVSAALPEKKLAAAAPAGDALPDQTGDAGVALPQAAPDATPLPQGELNADRMTAELAWSGGADSQIDAQALATIQSFMQPRDIGSQSFETRDALTALLSQVPCARLQAEFDPVTGSIVLRGHIPQEELREPVLAALRAQVGQGLPVVDEMLILGRPQCGALSGIGAVGLPQSTDQNTDARLIGPNLQAAVFDYRGGQTLRFGMQAPDYDAYVYVDYFDAGGNVFHIVPNQAMPLVLSPAKSDLEFQAVGPNGEEIRIGPPYGQEIAVAFAASAPLSDEVRPIVEPAEPYLEWLRTRVAEARAADPAFKGEWVYFFVSTRAE